MSLETLRARLVDRLEPVETWRPELVAARSDFDLNPQATRTAKELRPAAVLIPIVARPEGATVLLTRRADTLARHTGQIAFPGGGWILARPQFRRRCVRRTRRWR